VTSGIGDVGGDACEELERVEPLEVSTEAGVELRGIEDLAGRGIEGEFLEREGSPGDVAGEGLDGVRFVRFDAHGVVEVEARMAPVEERVEEALGETLGAMEAMEEESAEDLLHGRRGEERQGEKRAVGEERPLGDEEVEMGVEVEEVGEGLDGGDDAGARGLLLEGRAEDAQDRVVGGLREKGEEAAIAREEAADRAGDREDPLGVGDGREKILDEPLRPEGSTSASRDRRGTTSRTLPRGGGRPSRSRSGSCRRSSSRGRCRRCSSGPRSDTDPRRPDPRACRGSGAGGDRRTTRCRPRSTPATPSPVPPGVRAGGVRRARSRIRGARVRTGQRLVIKDDKKKVSIVVPPFVQNVAKVQIWCAWAETLLGEASFETAVR
jgi:hypothetical protein